MAVEVAKDASTLFSCPKEGCVQVYERYSNLEKHMSFGKCEMILKKETSLDKAKITYHTFLQDDDNTVQEHLQQEKRRAWMVSAYLRAGKDVGTVHDEAQRKYLEETFKLGSKQVTSKTLSKWREICVLQKKQMVRGCFRVMIS